MVCSHTLTSLSMCVCSACVCVTVAIDVHWHQETKGPKAEDKLTRSAKISKQDKVHLLCVMVFLIHQFYIFPIPQKIKENMYAPYFPR